MKIGYTILIFLITIFVNAQVKNIIEKKADNYENIYKLNDDKEMDNAIINAKESLSKFDISLKSNDTILKHFCLKKAFKTPMGDEHIWIESIMYSTKLEKYIGILGNEPLYVKNVKKGDIIEIDIDEISDWSYLEGNKSKGYKLIGGFTTRLLVSRMSKSERIDFDTNSGLIIE
ncbi:DUF2314 domain-containing protein [Flavobacterium sp.]|uniref:DUF2314 domain-containing protein n=1 Tax=Flavobacterium sp. TaxID=239 RepID=UPI00286E3C8E|nr:DUF2314 domain-containing protein [Flavobacterium sp.]